MALPSQSTLVSAVAAERKWSLLSYGGLFAVSAVLGGGAASDLWGSRSWVLFAFPVGFVGLLGFLLSLVRRNKALQSLNHAPETVVWIYPTHVNSNRGRWTELVVGTEDGGLHSIRLGRAEDEAAALEEAQSCAPNAVVGYRTDWPAAFRKSPKAFPQVANATRGP